MHSPSLPFRAFCALAGILLACGICRAQVVAPWGPSRTLPPRPPAVAQPLVSPLAAPAKIALASSTFTRDTEKWSVFPPGEATLKLGNERDGASLRTYLLGVPKDGNHATYYFQAPKPFVLDRRAAYGSALAWVQQNVASSLQPGDNPDVILQGGINGHDHHLEFRFSAAFRAYATSGRWVQLVAPLVENSDPSVGSWRSDESDGRPSQQEFLCTLMGLTTVRIRGDYGGTSSRLDAVVLGGFSGTPGNVAFTPKEVSKSIPPGTQVATTVTLSTQGPLAARADYVTQKGSPAFRQDINARGYHGVIPPPYQGPPKFEFVVTYNAPRPPTPEGDIGEIQFANVGAAAAKVSYLLKGNIPVPGLYVTDPLPPQPLVFDRQVVGTLPTTKLITVLNTTGQLMYVKASALKPPLSAAIAGKEFKIIPGPSTQGITYTPSASDPIDRPIVQTLTLTTSKLVPPQVRTIEIRVEPGGSLKLRPGDGGMFTPPKHYLELQEKFPVIWENTGASAIAVNWEIDDPSWDKNNPADRPVFTAVVAGGSSNATDTAGSYQTAPGEGIAFVLRFAAPPGDYEGVLTLKYKVQGQALERTDRLVLKATSLPDDLTVTLGPESSRDFGTNRTPMGNGVVRQGAVKIKNNSTHQVWVEWGIGPQPKDEMGNVLMNRGIYGTNLGPGFHGRRALSAGETVDVAILLGPNTDPGPPNPNGFDLYPFIGFLDLDWFDINASRDRNYRASFKGLYETPSWHPM